MKFLYSPWRSKYLNEAENKKENISKENCVFCQQLNDNKDEKNFILGRYKYNAIMLNLYPYNAGHLLILPYKHINNLNDLTKDERIEFMQLMTESINILQTKLKCEGINIGLNLGSAAGGGIPSHLHKHVLPRWHGDTNFLATLADTKTISLDLNKIYQDLKPEFEKIKV